jgi:hypothetical protein
MRSRLLILILIVNEYAAIATAQSTKSGSVCIAPFPARSGDAALVLLRHKP